MEKIWLTCGLLAIVFALANLSTLLTGRSPEVFRFLSLALTALTVCSFYTSAALWVRENDWSALEDVVPAVSGMLWVLVPASILMNGITLFVNREKKS